MKNAWKTIEYLGKVAKIKVFRRLTKNIRNGWIVTFMEFYTAVSNVLFCPHIVYHWFIDCPKIRCHLSIHIEPFRNMWRQTLSATLQKNKNFYPFNCGLGSSLSSHDLSTRLKGQRNVYRLFFNLFFWII